MQILSNIFTLITSLLDILIVAFFIYVLLRLLSRSEKLIMIINIFLVYVGLYLFSNVLGLNMVQGIMTNVSAWIVVIIVILFKEEIREGLEHLGNVDSFFGSKASAEEEFIDVLIETVFEMGKERTGALLTLEQSSSLTQYTKNAVKIEALFSKELAITLFNKKSLVHDGGMIIKNNKILYASAYYPISLTLDINKQYGTRHRAALTLSSETDSITIIASEESGKISIAYRAKLYTNVSKEFLKEFLLEKSGKEEE